MNAREEISAVLPNCPPDLAGVLRRLSAEIVRVTDHFPRYHVRLQSPEGPLFGWYSLDPADHAALGHELAVRDALGTSGILRAPAVLEHGPSWRVERMISSEQIAGKDALRLVVEAASVLSRLHLPPILEAPQRRRRRAVWGRRARLLLSMLPTREVVRARRLLRHSALPIVTSHGEFHPKHVFVTDGAVWIIDWEGLGRRPLGFDLMQMWCSLEDSRDRQHLFDLALQLVGPDMERELLKLRYATLVQRISAMLAVPRQFGDRDPETARSLLALLGDTRAQVVT